MGWPQSTLEISTEKRVWDWWEGLKVKVYTTSSSRNLKVQIWNHCYKILVKQTMDIENNYVSRNLRFGSWWLYSWSDEILWSEQLRAL